MTMPSLVGYGPLIGATALARDDSEIMIRPNLPDAQDTARYVDFHLERLAPIFDVIAESARVLNVVDSPSFPHSIESVSATNPDIIDFMFEVPGIEPELLFKNFIQGAAIVSLTLSQAQRLGVKEALSTIGSNITNGGDLPAISIDFYDEVRSLETKLFANMEPISWAPILSFMRGAFWLLGFISEPRKKIKSISALSLAYDACERSINLGYVVA